MLAIIGSTLVVQVQGKVSHLLPVSLRLKVGASLPNHHREAVAVAWVGAAAIALLVEVAKGQAKALEQGRPSVPAKRTVWHLTVLASGHNPYEQGKASLE